MHKLGAYCAALAVIGFCPSSAAAQPSEPSAVYRLVQAGSVGGVVGRGPKDLSGGPPAQKKPKRKPKRKSQPKRKPKPFATPKKSNTPNLSGTWSGWGSVTLRKTGAGTYTGTYSQTYSSQTGVISLRFNGRTGNGSWGEGSLSGGRILRATVSADGSTITGTYNRTRHFAGRTHGATSFSWRRR